MRERGGIKKKRERERGEGERRREGRREREGEVVRERGGDRKRILFKPSCFLLLPLKSE